jgi:hypothetical protein
MRESYSLSIVLCQYCALDECITSSNEDWLQWKRIDSTFLRLNMWHVDSWNERFAHCIGGQQSHVNLGHIASFGICSKTSFT